MLRGPFWRLAAYAARVLLIAPIVVLVSHANAQKLTPEAARNEAFEVAQRAMSTSAGAALAQLGVRFAAGSDDLAALVRARQDSLEAWKADDRRLAQALAGGGRVSDDRLSELRERMNGLQQKIADADKELATRFPAYAELAQPRPLALMEAQSLLGSGEAMVMIFSAERETFVWALSREHAMWARVDRSRKQLTDSVKRLREGLNPGAPAVFRSAVRSFGETVVEGGDTLDHPRFERELAFRLWGDLLAPVREVTDGAARLFIVAEAPFDSLPFNLLVTSQPEGDDRDPQALRATDWLIRKHAIVTLPTAASLRALRQAREIARAPEPFRGYGAPNFAGAPQQVASLRSAGTAASVFEAGRVSLDAVRSLAPLPQTEGELLQLAKVLDAPQGSVRLGGQATEAAVKSDDLARFRVLAFATHGLLAGEIGGLVEPALAFTPPAEATPQDDGLLTASEAARLNLNADWVILSACNTASGDGTPGASGLSGLARAFFYAGAKTLLVSHWPVRDDAAARLTSQAFEVLARDASLGKADAFRQSMLALLRDESDPTLAHPAIWAPFVVVGEGR
ncbi:MAG: CHAT domain-containing protein [Beijerinckiaceae bacterium]